MPPTLLSTLASYSLEEALEEGAPQGSAAYLQLVLEVLEDGELSVSEGAALRELAIAYRLSPDDVGAAHRGFLVALAQRAVDDDRVSRAEREELRLIARLLDLPETLVPSAIARAREIKAADLSQGLEPLPEEWALGEPLRVGDRVAITGCAQHDRPGLERMAAEAGVIVTGGVSRRTVMLVSDGTVAGTKAGAAQEHGTRIVTPQDFVQFLRYVQPPRPSAPKSQRKVAEKTNGNPPDLTAASPSEIRRWAQANGIEVGARGRLNQEVVDAFLRAREQDRDTA